MNEADLQEMPIEAVREAVYSGKYILATAQGLKLITEKVRQEAQRGADTQLEIGQQSDTDGDWKEDNNLALLKTIAFALKVSLAEYAADLSRARLYVEPNDDGTHVVFGSTVEMLFRPVGSNEARVRKIALLGPLEAGLSQRTIAAPGTNNEFTITSYESRIGQALWGAECREYEPGELTFQPRSELHANNPDGRIEILVIRRVGKII